VPVLDWIGREQVLHHDREVPFRILKPIKSLSVGNGAGNGNLLIHGDNLEALKALMPFYYGFIKCVYIDPPYNTGKEGWKYNDRVDSPKIREWLGKVVGPEAEDLCRHDKWLCMMYPRLRLLKDLLQNDGVIFVSIDDNEVNNLKILMDDIFGPSNFITQFIWNTEGHTDNQFQVKVNHEYVLAYAKTQETRLGYVVDPSTREDSNLWKGLAENSITKNGPGNPPSEVQLPLGFPCAVDRLDLPPSRIDHRFYQEVERQGYITREMTRKFSVVYPIRKDRMVSKAGKLSQKCRVYSGWANVKKLKAFIDNGCQPVQDRGDTLTFYISNRGVIYYKRERTRARSILSVLRNMGTTEQMRSELERQGIKFPYPKPKQLIKYLLRIGLVEDTGIVLDSFAGSGTTGQAVLELDKEDGGNRRFILVEMEDDVCELITRARLERVIKGYSFRGEKVEGTGGDFQYCELGPSLFDNGGTINKECTFADLAKYVYFTETKTALASRPSGCRLGECEGTAYYLIFEGVGSAKNVLNYNFLKRQVRYEDRRKVIYADKCLIDDDELADNNITFKQIPYSIRVF